MPRMPRPTVLVSRRQVEERVDILKRLDVEKALPIFQALGLPPAVHDVTGLPVGQAEIVLATMHKVRVQMGAKFFTVTELKASKDWLRERHWVIPGEER